MRGAAALPPVPDRASLPSLVIAPDPPGSAADHADPLQRQAVAKVVEQAALDVLVEHDPRVAADDARLPRQFAGERPGAVDQLARRQDLVDDAEALCLLDADLLAGQEEIAPTGR